MVVELVLVLKRSCRKTRTPKVEVADLSSTTALTPRASAPHPPRYLFAGSLRIRDMKR